MSDPLVSLKSLYVIFYNVVWTSHIVYYHFERTFFVAGEYDPLAQKYPKRQFSGYNFNRSPSTNIENYVGTSLFHNLNMTKCFICYFINMIYINSWRNLSIKLSNIYIKNMGEIWLTILSKLVRFTWINIPMSVFSTNLINFTIMRLWHKTTK